ncbi:MAG: hypothetical protein QW655_04305 [Nitrososphaerota archaeon]
MNRTLYMIALILVASLLLPTYITTIHADGSGIEILDYYWGRLGERWAVVPGDIDAKLTLVILNKEDTTICGLKAYIYEVGKDVPYPFYDKHGERVIKSYYEGYIRVGEARSIEFDVSVVPEASPGTYDVNVYFEYMDCEDPDYPILSHRTRLKLKVWDLPRIDIIDSKWTEQDGSPTYAGPGDNAKFLTLTFYVPRYYAVLNPKATLYLSEYFMNLTGGNVVEEFLSGQIQGGGTFTIRFGLNISPNTPTGTHTLKLVLTYYDKWFSQIRQEINVPVKITGRGEIDIDLRGFVMNAGSTQLLDIVIKNKGSAPIYDIKARAISEGGVIVISEITKDVDVLYPRESFTFRPVVFAPPTIPESSYSTTITVSYIDSSGVKRSETRGVGIYVRSPPAMSLTTYVKGEELVASKKSRITVVLKNLYDSSITDVKTLITLKGLPITIIEGEQTSYFPELKANGEAPINLVLLVSPRAEESVYEGTLTVTYRDPYGQIKTETLSVPLVIKGLLRISFKQVQIGASTVYPGSIVDVLGEILNAGTITARLTDVRLELQEPFFETQFSRYYIGDISPYSTSSFTLSFGISENAKPGRYMITLVAECENTFGEKVEVKQPIVVEVVEKPVQTSITSGGSQKLLLSFSDMLILTTISLVAIVLVVVLIRRSRRRKKIEAT